MTTVTATSTGLPPRTAAALAYGAWWITGLIFWLLERDDRFVRFHAAQSITAFGILAALIAGFTAVAGASLSFLPEAFLPLLGAALVTWVAALVLWMVAMWKAANGNAWRIPLAADLADRLV
ncbi:MAG TPA: DUF4870 domain-containing protein [Vicinamibacterales bacterium]|nr:DUF4870 domain-containing protein [Vicinamibacterales bacterium]